MWDRSVSFVVPNFEDLTSAVMFCDQCAFLLRCGNLLDIKIVAFIEATLKISYEIT